MKLLCLFTSGMVFSFLIINYAFAYEKLNDVVTADVNNPFIITQTITKTANTNYRVKIRFSENPDKCEPKCLGETWNGSAWLGQTSNWDSFPQIQSDENGNLRLLVIGRINETTIPPYVQIVLRLADKDNATSNIEYVAGTTALAGDQSLLLQAYAPTGELYTNGYFSITNPDGETRNIPLTESPSVTTRASSQTLRVGFYSLENVEQITPTAFNLIDQGLHQINLGNHKQQQFHPKLETQKKSYPNNVHIATIITETPYTGRVNWYRNGEKLNENSEKIELIFTQSGSQKLDAVLESSDEIATAIIDVTPIANITLENILPNPEGRDTATERITIKNGNPFLVTLKNWELRSRFSRTKIKIDGSILPNDTMTITTTNKLTNDGGTYDLYNDVNDLVGTVTYAKPLEGAKIVRDGIFWSTDSKTSDTPTNNNADTVETSDEVVTIRGTVTKPQGRTIDIISNEKEVRVVLHPSFKGEKPRLNKGDVIEVTGTWKRSRRGPYVSVGEHNTFLLISKLTSNPNEPVTEKKSEIKTENPVIESANASEPVAPTTNEPVAQISSVIAPPAPIDATTKSGRPWRWVFIALISLGIALAFPNSNKKTV